MEKLPRDVRGLDLIAALQRRGFAIARRRGSHVRMTDGHGRGVTIPVHRGRTLQAKTLAAILDAASVTADELHDLL